MNETATETTNATKPAGDVKLRKQSACGVTMVIAHRELTSMFYSPIAYVVMCVYALLAGLSVVTNLFAEPGSQATMRDSYNLIMWILIAVLPAISMRLMSEELRSGTYEPLLSTPIRDIQVIFGKWLGAMGFFVLMLIPTYVHVILLEVFASPDYGPIFTGYLGIVLVGGFYIAIGLFASVITKNQIIAYLTAVFIILLFTLVMFMVSQYVPHSYAQWLGYANVMVQYDDFRKGLIDTGNVIFFLSGIGFFLILANAVLESRRWR